VAGRTVAVIGVGSMGGAVAAQAKKLKLRVLGVRRSRRPHRHVDAMFAPSELGRVLAQADFVVVAAPLTSETRGLLGAKELDLMKPGAGLINMGRAAIVDYEALRERLSSGRLGGAVLDVTDPEPLPAESPLWRTPNLIITPHVSSDDAERYTPRTLDLLFRNMKRFLSGVPLRNRIDRSAGY
jgi:phosphoglycerate dehydrogenase-like enzyme